MGSCKIDYVSDEKGKELYFPNKRTAMSKLKELTNKFQPQRFGLARKYASGFNIYRIDCKR